MSWDLTKDLDAFGGGERCNYLDDQKIPCSTAMIAWSMAGIAFGANAPRLKETTQASGLSSKGRRIGTVVMSMIACIEDEALPQYLLVAQARSGHATVSIWSTRKRKEGELDSEENRYPESQ